MINIDKDICKVYETRIFIVRTRSNWSLRNKIVDLSNLQDSMCRIEFILQSFFMPGGISGSYWIFIWIGRVYEAHTVSIFVRTK